MMRGYFRVDSRTPSQLWAELLPNGEKILCPVRQTERGLRQSGVSLLCKDPVEESGNRVATLDGLPSHFAADWMAGLRPRAAAAETVQIFCQDWRGCKQRLQSWERGRESLSGEMVGSRDVNAREREPTFGCWDGERKMATSGWEPRWFFFLSRGK